jgi:hypothetical protein
MTRDADERGKLALDAYVTDWARIIWDATGDQTKVDRAILLADLNGMFDPAKFAASRAPAPADGEALREECAKIADRHAAGWTLTPNGLARQDTAEQIAAEIRALSNAPAPVSGGARE